MVLPSEEEEDEVDVKAKPQENDDAGVDGAEDEEEEEERLGSRDGVDEGINDIDNDDNEVEGENIVDVSKEASLTTTQPPPKPVKRARLAYSIYCDEKRPEVQEEVSVRDFYDSG